MAEADSIQGGSPSSPAGPSDGAVFADTDCPVCDLDPGSLETVRCRKCSRPHHFACWLEKKGCAEPGCGHLDCEVPWIEGLAPEAVRLRRKAEPRMWFFVFFVAYVLAMYTTLFLLPEVLQDSMIFVLGVGFLFGCLGILLVQSLVSRAYCFEPDCGYVFKETQIGPFLWGKRRRWRRFDALTGVDLQLVRRSLQTGDQLSYVVQVWLRDAAGADLVLREEELRPNSPALSQVQMVARLLGIDLSVVLIGDQEDPQLHVSRITGMPLRAP